jgi:hypothetical protein
MSPITFLLVVAVLAFAATGILVALTIGIRLGDRGHLTNAPRSQSDALARRLLVGTRYPSESTEESDQ